MLPEEKLRYDRQVEATHQQQEIHNLKKRIAEEELLRLQDARRRDEALQEITELNLRRARLEYQKAANEAELASLKLEQFKRQVFFYYFP